MRALILILATVLLLASCSSAQQQRVALLNSLVGATETEVVRQLGVPSRTFEAEGHRFLAYREQRTSIAGPLLWGGGWAGWNDGWSYAGAWPADVIERVCETTIEVVDGRMATWTLRGNACS